MRVTDVAPTFDRGTLAIAKETINTFVSLQTSPETRRAYARDVRVFLDWIGGETDLTDDELIAFREWLMDRFAPAGAVRVWSTVKGLYRFARQTSGFDVIKGPKRIKNEMPHVPTDEDVDALVAASLHPDADGRVNARRALVIPLLLNGLRASEVGDLLRDGIERHSNATILRVVGKGRVERMIPASHEVEMALVRYEELASKRQRYADFAVTTPKGEHLNYRQIEHDVYRCAEIAGIECHPHALRHHYATRLIKAGVDSTFVQRLLGHARLDTTQRYVQLNLRDLVEAAKKDPRNQLTPLANVG